MGEQGHCQGEWQRGGLWVIYCPAACTPATILSCLVGGFDSGLAGDWLLAVPLLVSLGFSLVLPSVGNKAGYLSPRCSSM